MNELMYLARKHFEVACRKYGERAAEAALRVSEMESGKYNWNDNYEEEYMGGESFNSMRYDEEAFCVAI